MWYGKLPAAFAKVIAMAFAPDGRTLYTGDTKGCVLAWDLVTHTHRVLLRRVKTKYGIRAVAHLRLTPDGSQLFIEEGERLVDLLHPGTNLPLPADKSWGALLP